VGESTVVSVEKGEASFGEAETVEVVEEGEASLGEAETVEVKLGRIVKGYSDGDIVMEADTVGDGIGVGVRESDGN